MSNGWAEVLCGPLPYTEDEDTCLSEGLYSSTLTRPVVLIVPPLPFPSRQALGGPVLWSAGEDKLLFAIIHEFGENWALVADVLGSSSSLQGVSRSRSQCRERSREIKVRRHLP